MRRFSVFSVTLVAFGLIGCARTGQVGSTANGEYGLILTDWFWFGIDEVDPDYIMLAIDGQRTTDRVALFTYKESFQVVPGLHDVEYVCGNRIDGRRRVSIPVSAGYAYFLFTDEGRRFVRSEPTALTCPAGTINRHPDNPACSVSYRDIYESYCTPSVFQIRIEDTERLREFPFDFVAAGAVALPIPGPRF